MSMHKEADVVLRVCTFNPVTTSCPHILAYVVFVCMQFTPAHSKCSPQHLAGEAYVLPCYQAWQTIQAAIFMTSGFLPAVGDLLADHAKRTGGFGKEDKMQSR